MNERAGSFLITGRNQAKLDEAAAELTLSGGEDLVGDIGVHVGDQRVELHALALRDGAAQRADFVTDLEIQGRFLMSQEHSK